MLSRVIALVVLALCLSLGTRPASAVPVEFEFELTANWFGDDPPVLGFNSLAEALAAGPFVGHFAIDSAYLAPNQTLFGTPFLDFELTVGTAVFDETGVTYMYRHVTDAAGTLISWFVFVDVNDIRLSIHFNDPIDDDTFLEGWSVWDLSPNGPCGVSGIGKCFGGQGPDPGAGVVTFAPVPEPASLALLGFGLAGLCLTRRRRAA